MTTLQLIEHGTGGDGRRGAAPSKLVSMVPVGFAIAGALTGATVAVAPPSVLNWTSAHVHRLERVAEWVPPNSTIGGSRLVLTEPQSQLEGIKNDTGLTWGQIAHAMAVDVRTVHLWRNGGGISAAHEAHLHDLGFLVDSVRLREPSDARGQLVSTGSGRSLLDRFHDGASGQELALAAPWRSDAREALARNVVARTGGEPVDEGFAFLLYASDTGAAAFSTHADAMLEDPSTTRQAWESEIDRQLADAEQPPIVDAAATSGVHAAYANGEAERVPVAPLFGLDDLGITLGVGAIASRPAVSEEQ